MNPPVAGLPEATATDSVPGSLLCLVDEKVSYPPVPSPTSLTPSQLFSPGQIHMHKEGHRDGGMDG